ncbi:unnamed protein product [Urochloa decumbens]|uniref:F-box domain-containing protein n=1 Tax=Urochloa decumbens TaxID=240449 RepID=A0ABC9G825_9POAL
MDVAMSPRRRKRRRNQNRSARGLRSCGAIDAIPDDALELILLLLDSQVSLLRAASTCKRWRRIAAGDAFLRRFSSLHELPVVAGSYHNSLLHARPRFVEPSPRPTDVDRGHFSLDFLPDNSIIQTRWSIIDSKESILLLEREDKGTWDLIVCEPLTRRHEVIPPILTESGCYLRGQAFLLGGSGIGMSNFRVLCWVLGGGRTQAFMFTAGASWCSMSIDSRKRYDLIGSADRALYWHDGDRTVIAVDKATAEFSYFLLPPGGFGMSTEKIAVAVGSDGEPRFVLSDGRANGILKVFATAGGEWVLQLEKSIQLRAATATLHLPRWERWCFIHGVGGGQSTGTLRVQTYTAGFKRLRKFSIDIETMKVESLPDMYMHRRTYPTMLPWPPSMHACTSDN